VSRKPLPTQTLDPQAATTTSVAPGLEAELRLSQVALREEVEFVGFDMPEEASEPLLERGILPGCRLCPVRLSPFGDPVVMVEGTMVALRRETAGCLCVKRVRH